MKQLCTRIIHYLIDICQLNKAEEDVEVYVYGLLSLLYSVLPFSCLLFLSLLLKQTPEMLFWIFAFLSFRKYAGGFHAKTATKCFLYSILLGLSSLIVHSFSPNSSITFYVICIILNSFFLLIFAPLTHKDFSFKQKLLCKIKTGLLIICFTLFTQFFSFLQIYYLHALTSTTLLCIAYKLHR